MVHEVSRTDELAERRRASSIDHAGLEVEEHRAWYVLSARGLVVSPTHKRTEERAPVWGSEFTSKAIKLQGGSSRNRCYAECKVVGSGGDW
jgi:hypothetical protein